MRYVGVTVCAGLLFDGVSTTAVRPRRFLVVKRGDFLLNLPLHTPAMSGHMGSAPLPERRCGRTALASPSVNPLRLFLFLGLLDPLLELIYAPAQ